MSKSTVSSYTVQLINPPSMSSIATIMNTDKRPLCQDSPSAADTKKSKQTTTLSDNNYLPTDGTKLPKIVPVEGDVFLTIQERDIPDGEQGAAVLVEAEMFVLEAKLE